MQLSLLIKTQTTIKESKLEETHVVDLWSMFKEYVDQKSIESIAEKYVDLLADLGIDDRVLIAAIGTDSALDAAIKYYLELDTEEDDSEGWE